MKRLCTFCVGQGMDEKKKVRLLVVDDHRGYCDLIRNNAEMWHYAYDLECEFASDAQEAFELIRDFCPTVIMLDAYIPDINCIDFIDAHRDGKATIVVTSEHPSTSLQQSVTAKGATVYVAKTDDPDELDVTLGKIAWIATEDSSVH
ncbi:response regulator [Oligoflexia bacterium]|nr:response regulator [Oligoflexia bacterium]